MKIVAKATTTAVTIPLMASTSFVFRRKRGRMARRRSGAGFGSRSHRGCLVLLQLIVQGLQANAEDFRRPRLVVAGGFQSLENEQPLGFADSGAHAQANGITFAGGNARRGMA